MLEFILPPIVIVVALGALFWLFYKKRDVLAKIASGQRLSRTVKPPKMSSIFSGGEKEEKFEVGGRRKHLHARAVYFAKKIPAFPRIDAMREKARAVFSRKKKFTQKDVFLKSNDDVSALDADTRNESGETSMRTVDHIGAHEKIHVRSQRARAPKRPLEMVSQKMTKPQQRNAEEKDQYEQLLVERIALNPKDIEAYERLGDYYLEWQSYQDAKECYKQVLRLSPMNRRAKIRMRRVEKVLG